MRFTDGDLFGFDVVEFFADDSEIFRTRLESASTTLIASRTFGATGYYDTTQQMLKKIHKIGVEAVIEPGVELRVFWEYQSDGGYQRQHLLTIDGDNADGEIEPDGRRTYARARVSVPRFRIGRWHIEAHKTNAGNDSFGKCRVVRLDQEVSTYPPRQK